MVIILFSCINSTGEFNECSFGGFDIESCFDTLNQLTNAGWQIVSAKLLDAPGTGMVELPVEAFTGEPMKPELQRLQRTWQYLLEDQTIMMKQYAARTICYASESLQQVREKREHTNRRIKNLFERLDRIQVRIQETKDEWGVM